MERHVLPASARKRWTCNSPVTGVHPHPHKSFRIDSASSSRSLEIHLSLRPRKRKLLPLLAVILHRRLLHLSKQPQLLPPQPLYNALLLFPFLPLPPPPPLPPFNTPARTRPLPLPPSSPLKTLPQSPNELRTRRELLPHPLNHPLESLRMRQPAYVFGEAAQGEFEVGAREA